MDQNVGQWLLHFRTNTVLYIIHWFTSIAIWGLLCLDPLQPLLVSCHGVQILFLSHFKISESKQKIFICFPILRVYSRSVLIFPNQLFVAECSKFELSLPNDLSAIDRAHDLWVIIDTGVDIVSPLSCMFWSFINHWPDVLLIVFCNGFRGQVRYILFALEIKQKRNISSLVFPGVNLPLVHFIELDVWGHNM